MDTPTLHKTIARNLTALRNNIAQTANAADRDPNSIRLIAVSKTWPPAVIEAAIAAGQRVFGENKVQEALSKLPQLEHQRLEWHYIGRLQSNKAKYIPGRFAWLHTVHQSALLDRLERAAVETGGHIKALLQVNMTQDPRKQGIDPEQLIPIMENILAADYRNVGVHGLMTIGPYSAEEAESRDCFSGLRRLRDECAERFGLRDFCELSMGMSGDYPWAIAEGATMIRIGGAIFGARPPAATKPA